MRNLLLLLVLANVLYWMWGRFVDDPPETGGYYTPSQLLGHHFAGELEGSSEIQIHQGSSKEVVS